MDTNQARALVLDAFDPDCGVYYHQIPHKPCNFIDGMAWVGLCCGAAFKVGDVELANKCEVFLRTLLLVSPKHDARNYAKLQVKPEWVASPTMPGFWYYPKEQATEGPLALQYAIDNGAKLDQPFNAKSKAKLLAATGWAFGITARYVSFVRQYVNSVWTSFLVLGKKPPSTMNWMAEENPFFSAIAGKKCSVAYPLTKRFFNGKEKTSKNVVPLQKAEPSAWVFRRDPFNEYYDGGSGELETDEYVPIAQLVGDYLQKSV